MLMLDMPGVQSWPISASITHLTTFFNGVGKPYPTTWGSKASAEASELCWLKWGRIGQHCVCIPCCSDGTNKEELEGDDPQILRFPQNQITQRNPSARTYLSTLSIATSNPSTEKEKASVRSCLSPDFPCTLLFYNLPRRKEAAPNVLKMISQWVSLLWNSIYCAFIFLLPTTLESGAWNGSLALVYQFYERSPLV